MMNYLNPVSLSAIPTELVNMIPKFPYNVKIIQKSFFRNLCIVKKFNIVCVTAKPGQDQDLNPH